MPRGHLMVVLALGAGLVAAPAAALAEEPSPAVEAGAAPSAEAAPAPSPAPLPQLGVALGAGFPQFATLDLAYRPLPWLRLQAGPSWDYAGWGLHGGAFVAPYRWLLTPTLGLEGGRFFTADANHFVSADPEVQPLLRRVTVKYLAATLGVEIGSQRGFSFFLRTGLSWIWVDSSGTGQLTGTSGTPGANDAQVTITDPVIRASSPTLQLGCQYFF